MPKLFGTAGIRAEYPERVNPLFALKLGLALAIYLDNKGTITIGHDTRTTSQLLAYSLASGAMSGGLSIDFLGLAPTPITAYATRKRRNRAGVSVTASHNPPQYNGFKVFDENGMEYTVDMEEELEKNIDFVERNTVFNDWDKVGKLVLDTEVTENYVEELVSRTKPEGKNFELKVIVDCANGAAYEVTPRVLREIGARTLTIHCNPDGFFPGRIPEPRPDVLTYIHSLLRVLEADLALAQDGDADRLSVITRKQGFIKQDRLIALYAKMKLLDRKGVIIVSIDVGHAVEEIVDKYGGKLVRWKLGKTHEKLKENPNALLAAEPWKLIDPAWGFWVDGIYQAALLTKLSIENKGLDNLFKDIPDYPSKRFSVKIPKHKIGSVYNTIVEELLAKSDSAKITTIDGVRLDYEDGSWLLVRKSGTEPKIRFYMEALTKGRLNELIDYSMKLLRRAVEVHGVKLGEIEGLGM